jgi:hypothetical protein
MTKFITAVLLILFAAFSRLIPHPMNFAPVAAIALFAGVYLDKKYTFIVPVAAMLLSDMFLGFYSGIQWVYGSFILIAFIGFWLKKRSENASTGKRTVLTGTTALVASIVFFVVTNFGVWISGTLYAISWSGLVQCYTMALPFFRNTAAGDLIYTGAMFVLYEVITRYAITPVPQKSRITK